MSWYSTYRSYGDDMNHIAQGLTAINDRCCRLMWKAIQDNNHDYFNVYCQEGMAGTIELVCTGVPTNEYVSAPLRYDIDYNFYVTSVNKTGMESAMSAPIYFKLSEAGNVLPSIHYPTKQTVTLDSTPFVIDLTNMTKDTKIIFEVIL